MTCGVLPWVETGFPVSGSSLRGRPPCPGIAVLSGDFAHFGLFSHPPVSVPCGARPATAPLPRGACPVAPARSARPPCPVQAASCEGRLGSPAGRGRLAPLFPDRASTHPSGTDNPSPAKGAASARGRPWKRKLWLVTGTGQRG